MSMRMVPWLFSLSARTPGSVMQGAVNVDLAAGMLLDVLVVVVLLPLPEAVVGSEEVEEEEGAVPDDDAADDVAPGRSGCLWPRLPVPLPSLSLSPLSSRLRLPP